MVNRNAKQMLNDLFRASSKIQCQRGQVVLQAGDPPDGVYLITSGYIKVYSIRSTGDLSLHVIYKPGELFPLLWTYRGTNTNAYYEAMDDATLYRCDREQFLTMVFSHSEVAEIMLRQLSEVHWVLANRIENLELARARDKIVFRLAFLGQRFGRGQKSGQILIQAPITHKDIADSVSMIRETASRELEKLEKEGLIGYQDHKLVLLKPEELTAKLN